MSIYTRHGLKLAYDKYDDFPQAIRKAIREAPFELEITSVLKAVKSAKSKKTSVARVVQQIDIEMKREYKRRAKTELVKK